MLSFNVIGGITIEYAKKSLGTVLLDHFHSWLHLLGAGDDWKIGIEYYFVTCISRVTLDLSKNPFRRICNPTSLNISIYNAKSSTFGRKLLKKRNFRPNYLYGSGNMRTFAEDKQI